MSPSPLNKKPLKAPGNYREMEPVVETEEGLFWVGSGVPWAEHPAHPDRLRFVTTPPDCRECGSHDVQVIYLAKAPNVGAGRDLNVEVFCPACESYSYHTYID